METTLVCNHKSYTFGVIEKKNFLENFRQKRMGPLDKCHIELGNGHSVLYSKKKWFFYRVQNCTC
jgi:hypothetical protein